jgi:hypothetical protein
MQSDLKAPSWETISRLFELFRQTAPLSCRDQRWFRWASLCIREFVCEPHTLYWAFSQGADHTTSSAQVHDIGSSSGALETPQLEILASSVSATHSEDANGQNK